MSTRSMKVTMTSERKYALFRSAIFSRGSYFFPCAGTPFPDPSSWAIWLCISSLVAHTDDPPTFGSTAQFFMITRFRHKKTRANAPVVGDEWGTTHLRVG
jgi:hypothetical protein